MALTASKIKYHLQLHDTNSQWSQLSAALQLFHPAMEWLNSINSNKEITNETWNILQISSSKLVLVNNKTLKVVNLRDSKILNHSIEKMEFEPNLMRVHGRLVALCNDTRVEILKLGLVADSTHLQ
jgi:Fe-S cluster biosynthesis and repair protein YggX